jgi:hypothetical protein
MNTPNRFSFTDFMSILEISALLMKISQLVIMSLLVEASVKYEQTIFSVIFLNELRVF